MKCSIDRINTPPPGPTTAAIFFYSPDRGLDSIQTSRRISILLKMVNLKEMIHCLEDLINYFAYPEDELGELAQTHTRTQAPFLHDSFL